jgi:hypothetical protein
MKMSTFQGSRERDIDWKVGREDSYLGEREGRGRRIERRELVVGKGMEECEYGFFHLNGNNIFL